MQVALWVAMMLTTTPVWAQQQATRQAVPQPQWNALFERRAGWTGADGIYSLSADGWDAPSDPHGVPTTLFVFSDTFIGRVAPDGTRPAPVQLVHNTAAMLKGVLPDPLGIGFVWGHADGNPAPLLTPQTPQTQAGDWYWPVDGLVSGGVLELFAQRMTTAGVSGPFNFAVAGISLIRQSLHDGGLHGGGLHGGAATQRDTPFFVPATAEVGSMQFGDAVMANTAEAGSPMADGYVYVYGVRNDSTTKWLLAARVKQGDVDRFDAWRFWDGSGWNAAIGSAAPIIDRLSSEFSVTPLADGRYALVYQLDTLSNHVAISIGHSPVGLFSKARIIYTCPEPGEDPTHQVYTYNAKAHPALSAPGHLLISYNVNSFSLGQTLRHGAIYHPRFVDLDLGTADQPAAATARPAESR